MEAGIILSRSNDPAECSVVLGIGVAAHPQGARCTPGTPDLEVLR
jgi:hypothetical protein